MRTTLSWRSLAASHEHMPFANQHCRHCGDDVRAQQLHAALERVYRNPDANVPSRGVSFSCVHDGQRFCELAMVSLIARAHRECKRDSRCTNGTLSSRLVLVGFWSNEDDDFVHRSGCDYVRVGGDVDGVSTELQQRTRSGISAHINDQAEERIRFWAEAYNEVVFDRYRLPTEAWHMAWSDIHVDVKDLAVRLFDQWAANPDFLTMRSWAEKAPKVIAGVLGREGDDDDVADRMCSTEQPLTSLAQSR